MMIESFSDLIPAYLEEHLKGKPSHRVQQRVARQWLMTLTEIPTRTQLMDRHKFKGHGHYEHGCAQANAELSLLRAACRWGIYTERWSGGDPTVGIKKWKTKRRTRVSKFEEMKLILAHFERATTTIEIRDRALFGLMWFTGCRPKEAGSAKLTDITPYGEMGCWNKGKTKNGNDYEVPVPSQYMPWLAAWKAIRPQSSNPYLFPGLAFQQSITDSLIIRRWHDLRLILGLHGLWNYDLRRSLASHLSNELNYADAKIDAILGHEKKSSLGHYLHVSFDAMTKPIQHYADWLWALKQAANDGSHHPVVAFEQELVPVPAFPVPQQPPPEAATPEEEEWGPPKLSGRERQVYDLLVQGRSILDIARAIPLSAATVHTVKTRLEGKLQRSVTGSKVIHLEDGRDIRLSSAVASVTASEEDERKSPPLSGREREVLAWLSHGHSCKDIAARLGISIKTVSTYRTRLLDKLHLMKTTDLVRYAIAHEADTITPVPAQSPVITAPVVSPMMPAPMPIVHSSHRYEREDWPG
jgi:DNA-binding CsgD family transcriptional regulator/integrase